MDSGVHQELVAVIRSVSEKLREEYSKSGGDYEKVWQDHLIDHEVREQYAQSMLKLATEIWPQVDSRIHWCYKVINDYFHGGGLTRSLKREYHNLLRQQKMVDAEAVRNMYLTEGCYKNGKLKLLDVGSCYDPFSEFLDLETVSIDLTPVSEGVYQCDFLQLDILPSSDSLTNFPKPPAKLNQLKQESFHIIVFSLYLSYLPAAEQRFISCSKAWKLLKRNGLLLLITPDSKSQHHNAAMIKSWKCALEHLSFFRVIYEKKKHLHCMAYRKTLASHCLHDVQCSDITKMIYIPQDFKEFQDVPPTSSRTNEDDENVRHMFFELPFCSDML